MGMYSTCFKTYENSITIQQEIKEQYEWKYYFNVDWNFWDSDFLLRCFLVHNQDKLFS
jgi:hypothetical protein